MTLTRAGVMQRLSDIDSDLEAMISEEEEHPAAAYYREKREFERQYAETYLGKEGTVEERRQKTIVALYQSGHYKQLVVAEAAWEAWRAKEKVLEARASIGQSLLRAMGREGDTHGVQPSWSVREGSVA